MLEPDPTQVARWRAVRDAVTADPAQVGALLAPAAAQARARVLPMVVKAKLGHLGGDFSVLDILTTLYGAVLRVDPLQPDMPERDRFILSKGHCSEALYATLAWAGFFSPDELATFNMPMSALNGHPNRRKVPGVETNTGALGHGLPVGVGVAVGARLQGWDSHVYVVCGDGEMQEGSNWEAAMTAGHRGLENLTLVVDRNGLQQGARVEETVGLEPFADKWTAFGWRVVGVDGHDHAALLAALTTRVGDDRPTCLVAKTTKGKGVSFMEDLAAWHHKVPTAEQLEAALVELAVTR